MKLLACHEFYQQFGGEDHSFLDEVSLLRPMGMKSLNTRATTTKFHAQSHGRRRAAACGTRLLYRELRRSSAVSVRT